MRAGILQSGLPRWAGPVIAVAGLGALATIWLLPIGERGAVGWWIVSQAISIRHILPLVGLGAALALLPWPASMLAYLAFAAALIFGQHSIEMLLAVAAAQTPHGWRAYLLVNPAAFIAAGVALVPPAKLRPFVAVFAALISGAAFAHFIRFTDPSYNDPSVARVGILFGLWLVAAVGLTLSSFRRPWFGIAGPIIGSWMIAIGLLYGATALVPPRSQPNRPPAAPQSPATAAKPLEEMQKAEPLFPDPSPSTRRRPPDIGPPNTF